MVDVRLCDRRDLAAARRFVTSALQGAFPPTEVTTGRAASYAGVLVELRPRHDRVTLQKNKRK